jgi:hypothetical protein
VSYSKQQELTDGKLSPEARFVFLTKTFLCRKMADLDYILERVLNRTRSSLPSSQDGTEEEEAILFDLLSKLHDQLFTITMDKWVSGLQGLDPPTYASDTRSRMEAVIKAIDSGIDTLTIKFPNRPRSQIVVSFCQRLKAALQVELEFMFQSQLEVL